MMSWISRGHGPGVRRTPPGVETNKALQSAWNRHGAESFAFRILEEIDLDELTYGRERALKERVAHWREVLGAAAI
jgi:hypothetical protein